MTVSSPHQTGVKTPCPNIGNSHQKALASTMTYAKVRDQILANTTELLDDFLLCSLIFFIWLQFDCRHKWKAEILEWYTIIAVC
jgi:hypothetical protein